MDDSATAVYDKLVSGVLSPEDFTTQQLFDLATQMVVAGNFQAKSVIYNQFIINHRAAMVSDKFRVFVFGYDMMRRRGEPKEALALLKKAPTLDISSEALAEYWQAIGQCYIALGDPECLKTQRIIFRLFEYDILPTDKRLFYLETMLAMKLYFGQMDDEETDTLFEKYSQILHSGQIPEGPVHDRAMAMLCDLKATAYIQREDWEKAQVLYLQAVAAAPAMRNKVVSAIGFLYSVWHEDLNYNAEPVGEMVALYKDNQSALQPADLTVYREQIHFVDLRLAAL